MNEHIFKSNVWLTMKNASMEKSYYEFRSKSINCWINSLSIFGLVASVLNLIIQLFFIRKSTTDPDPDHFPFHVIIYLSYIVTVTNTILSIFILSIPNSKAKRVLYYFQYFALGIALFSMNFSGTFYDVEPSKIFSYYGVEALVRIINIVGFFEYVDCFIMTLIDILFVLPLYLIFTKGIANGFLYAYVIFKICFIIVSYVIVYMRKINYYFLEEHKQGRDWFKNIIENMKSGFIHVKDNKICFINDFMKEIIVRNSKIMKIVRESKDRTNQQMIKENQTINDEFFDCEENSRKVLNELMKDFNNEPDYDEINYFEGLHEINNNNNITNHSYHHKFRSIPPAETNQVPFLELLKKQNSFIGSKFKLVGTRSIQIENNSMEKSVTFEVFCRHNRSQETKKDEFEIIFNDITKAKQIQEKKSETKYKSIFLSKIAHEFKNPLICITELVDQLRENFRQIKEGDKDSIMKSEDNLNQINSFSNYLMILIRDLDYFSQEIQMKKVSLEIEECELEEILSFSNDIALSLLKRNGKDKNITFEIDSADDLPDYVMTDEFKLKQVLINIISNAIKFTNQGKVALSVHKQESDIEFRVSDTGVGIDSESINNLLAPNNPHRLNSLNTQGSNMGMSIILNLTQAMGNKIEITSELNKGSNFFFSIPIEFNNKNEIGNSSRTSTETKQIDGNNYSSLFSEDIQLIKEKEINFQGLRQKKRKLTEKSLFFKNSKSEAEDKAKVGQIELHETESNNEDINIIENNSSLNNSVVEFSKSNISSRGSTIKTNFLSYTKFLNPTFTNKPSSQNDINLEFNPLTFKRNIESDLTSVENLNFSKKSSFNSDYMQEINNTEKSKETKNENLLNKKNNIASNSDDSNLRSTQSMMSNKPTLLFDFIDQYQYFEMINFKEDTGYVNILLVDDEKLTRSANRRLITVFAKNNNIKVNFIEAEDGFECLYLLYVCIKKGFKISCVVSDQTMTYLDGTITAKVLKELTQNESLLRIPFYILTAYEDENIIKKLKQAPITNVFTKPIKKIFIEQIFEEINRLKG